MRLEIRKVAIKIPKSNRDKETDVITEIINLTTKENQGLSNQDLLRLSALQNQLDMRKRPGKHLLGQDVNRLKKGKEILVISFIWKSETARHQQYVMINNISNATH